MSFAIVLDDFLKGLLEQHDQHIIDVLVDVCYAKAEDARVSLKDDELALEWSLAGDGLRLVRVPARVR